MKDTLMEFSITPLGTPGPSVASFVAECVKLVKKSGLEFELHSMGTIVEGELESCLNLLKECIQTTLKTAPRASIAVKMDVRKGSSGGRISSKVESVKRLIK
jgi:uncharacterized protein (TIGR00106 family)